MYFISPLSVYFLMFLLSTQCLSTNAEEEEEEGIVERALARRNFKSNLLLFARFANYRILLSSLLNDRLLFITNVDIPKVYDVNISALSRRYLSLEGVKPEPLKTKFPALYHFPQFAQMRSRRKWFSNKTRSIAVNLDNEETLIFFCNYTSDSSLNVHFGAIVFSLTLNHSSVKDYSSPMNEFNFEKSHFISSSDPNVFFNFQTAQSATDGYDKLVKYSITGTTLVTMFTLRVCYNGIVNRTERITFWDVDSSPPRCVRVDWGDLWHYDGFTDSKNFYLFGRKDFVFVFEYPKNFADNTTVKFFRPRMQDFFQVHRSQLTINPLPWTHRAIPFTLAHKTTPYGFLDDFRVDMITLAVLCVGFAINFAIVYLCHRNRFRIGRFLRRMVGINEARFQAYGRRYAQMHLHRH